MNYLILFLLIFLFSCSSDKDLVDVEFYMKQGKEISLVKKNDFNEVKKINKLQLSTPVIVNDWLGYKLNASNDLPRFFIADFKKKASINIDVKSFLVIKKNIYLIDKYSNLIVLNENLKELKKKSIYKKKEFRDYILDFSMTSDGELIYISDNLGNIHAIDIKSFNIKWSLKLGVPIKSNLYLYNKDLFFINSNSKIYSIQSLNGNINWSHETPSKIFEVPYKISISNNFLITNNDYGEIYCYDLLKKNLLWKIGLLDQEYKNKIKNFQPGHFVSKDGMLYLSSNYGEFLAINEATGKVIWKHSISSSNLPIINKNYVFLINNDGYFYIFNKINGEIIYSNNLNKINLDKTKKLIFYNMILGKEHIYFINSGSDLVKINLNNLSISKNSEYSLKDPKDFFVLNNYLFILEYRKLSKFYN